MEPETNKLKNDARAGGQAAAPNSSKLQPPPINMPSTDNKPTNYKVSNQKDNDGWKSIASTILLLLLAPAIALSITAFAIQSYQVDGQSMETTLQNQDRLIVDKIPRTWARISHHKFVPNRGDIIIFNQSGLADPGFSGQKQLIKRVVGLPGETVKVSDGQVTVFNQQNPSGFNPDKAGIYHIDAAETSGLVPDTKLGPNQIFVMGDNRPNSEDSRYFGPVSADQIVGKLVLRLMPLSKIEKF